MSWENSGECGLRIVYILSVVACTIATKPLDSLSSFGFLFRFCEFLGGQGLHKTCQVEEQTMKSNGRHFGNSWKNNKMS